MMERYGAHNYHPLDVVLTRGEGAKVWDLDGKEYLDFLSCYSALNFGHQHPAIVRAMESQLKRLAVCSRAFYSEELAFFSKELAEFCGLETVLAMNSGTEAVETALKITRKWGYEKKRIPENRAKIIVMENSFHGRSIAIVSFSTEPTYKNGFGPFVSGFEVVRFGDIDAVEEAIDEDTVGVLVEPVQAEAGILIPPAGYLKKLRELCTQRGILLILDEIQTGMGRTGKDFCFQHEGITPDVLILGKSLGGGLLPVSAMVSTHQVMDVIRPGQHGSTFGGNPLAAAVGRSVLHLLREGKFSDRAQVLGDLALEALKREKLPKVREVRGSGFLIGIELDPSLGGARRFCEALARVGVLCKETHDHVIRIAPPLVIEEELLRHGINQVVEVITRLAR